MTSTEARPRVRYPWARWTDGHEHTITRGEDFYLDVYSMQISLHGRAKLEHKTARTRSFKRYESDGLGGARLIEGLTFRFTEAAK